MPRHSLPRHRARSGCGRARRWRSQPTRSGLSNAISQTTNQTKPIPPATKKPARQPSHAMMADTITAPIAGPAAAPAPNTALAKPRSEAGNHSRITRLHAGQLVDSPMPITMRVAAIETKPVVKPVSTVAADQMPIPEAFTTLPPKRSTRSPTGNRQITVHPQEGRQQVAHLDLRQMELGGDRCDRDRQRDAIGVVDQRQREQEDTDPEVCDDA